MKWNYKKVFKNREKRLRIISLLSFVPKSLYLKIVYRIKTGKKLNLKHPTGFNEKLQWLKIHDVHWDYSKYVDKSSARQIASELIGKEHCIPLIGQFKHYSDIDFDLLPSSFVIKCNHDSGSVMVINDKSKINHKELKKFYENRLRINSYCLAREYPYKKVKPMIIIEPIMGEPSEMNDYKFLCFNGIPKIMYVASNRAKDCRFDFYDMDMKHLDIYTTHPNADTPPQLPQTFELMKRFAGILAKGFKHVRIDFYEINGNIYFGEYTFFMGGGFYLFEPDEWEQYLGSLICIDE